MNTSAAQPEPSRDDGFVRPDNIGFRVRMVQLRMHQELRRAFKGAALTPGAHAILTAIRDNPGICQGDLADMLVVCPSNISNAIVSLEKAGLVARTVGRGDRRTITPALTEAGHRRLVRVQERVEALERMFLADFDPREQRQLCALLDRLLARLTPTPT